MQNNQKGFGAVEILLVILIIAVIGGAGAIVYSNKQDADKKSVNTNAQKASEKTDTTAKTTPKTEDEKILLAAGCKTGSTGCKIEDRFTDPKIGTVAWVTYSDDHGATNYYLSDDGGSEWSVVYSGNGDVPETVVNTYHIPEAWRGPQMDEVQ